MSDRIVVRREELYTAEVEDALEQERRLRAHRVPAPEPPTPLRRVLLSSLFYLPLSGALGALLAWAILEPSFDDCSRVAGTVVLVNNDPFEFLGDTGGHGPILLTIDDVEAMVLDGDTQLEPGPDGEPAFASVNDIQAGATVEVVGDLAEARRIGAIAVRPVSAERAAQIEDRLVGEIPVAGILLFPLSALCIAVGLVVAEGIASRNVIRAVERLAMGAPLAAVLTFVGMVPAGLMITVGEAAIEQQSSYTVKDIPPLPMLFFASMRGAAWATICAGMGFGLFLVRSTRVQMRNAAIGGALGGALGGAFFDPLSRFGSSSAFDGAEASRFVGLLAVGTFVGLFVALVDLLAREAWVRVLTGPLAGKSFVLYRERTVLGSRPESDVYLFKDAGISPSHAALHRVGNRYELEDLDSRAGTTVGGRGVRRHRLSAGDQIVVGATVLEFQERERGTGTGRD